MHSTDIGAQWRKGEMVQSIKRQLSEKMALNCFKWLRTRFWRETSAGSLRESGPILAVHPRDWISTRSLFFKFFLSRCKGLRMVDTQIHSSATVDCSFYVCLFAIVFIMFLELIKEAGQ